VQPPGITVRIVDVGDSPATYPPYFPIVNGSDIDFVHPFAMTILGNPARQLLTPNIMQDLIGNPCHVPADQLWAPNSGQCPERSSDGAVPDGTAPSSRITSVIPPWKPGPSPAWVSSGH
jgi:hypothetical protein